MPEQGDKQTLERAREALRKGKRPTTAAGEFVRKEVEHVRKGEHGARSPKQAIAIGLSKARRAGVPLEPPGEGQAGERTRRKAQQAYATGQKKRKPKAPSKKRSEATASALAREPRDTVSKQALSAQAKEAAKRRKRKA